MRKVLLLFFAVFTFEKNFAQDLNFELKKIRYCDTCGCNIENPISVKVCFKTDYKKIETLKTVVSYNKDFTYTSPVKEFDDKGNVYYTFCSKQGIITDFDIYFLTPSGKRSQVFAIVAIP